MKVVTYARVSTEGQKEGYSLESQERAFASWLTKVRATRVRAYMEAASAGTVEGRAEFSRMIDELPQTKPDIVVIDTLDRFTRNLRDGLNLLEALRGHKVGLLPLDWHRDRPIDIDDDREWEDVAREFMGAESERRRIRRRVRRYFSERRASGSHTVSKAALGILRTKAALLPDPDTSWLIGELDRTFLGGATLADTHRAMRALDERTWTTKQGVKTALLNSLYVTAGVRSREVQEAIAMRLEATSAFGKWRIYDHELTGVFVCGACLELGFPPASSKMCGIRHNTQQRLGDEARQALVCNRKTRGVRRHKTVIINESRIRPQWLAILDTLTAPDWLDSWASKEEGAVSDRTRKLFRRLSEIEQQATLIKERRDSALDLYRQVGKVALAEVERQLQSTAADEAALQAKRESLLSQMPGPAKAGRNVARIRAVLERFGEVYEAATVRERNELCRSLCAAFGSHPRLSRPGHSRWSAPVISWPEVLTADRPRRVRKSARGAVVLSPKA